jgi:Homeodomain-like domain
MGTCSDCGAPCPGTYCDGCTQPLEWSAALNVIYAPPYREFGAWYGPASAGAAHRELAEFQTSHYGAIGSPACWDEREEPRVLQRRAQQEAPRKDADLFEVRILMLGHVMPKRELECAMLFWRSRMSVARIAKHLGVKDSTVREWIKRTRERLGKSE